MPKKIPEDDDLDLDEDEAVEAIVESNADKSKTKVTMGEVAKMLGKSRPTVRRYVDRNLISPCEVSSAGVRFFRVADIEAFRDSGILDDTPEDPVEGQTNAAAQAMVSLVKESLMHARQSATLYFEPAARANESLYRVIDYQNARIRELEAREKEFFETREALYDKKLEREMMLTDAQARADNRRHMMREALKTLPVISTALAEKFGLSPLTGKLMKFLTVLDRDKLGMLLSPKLGLLSDEERGVLSEVLIEAGVEVPTASSELEAEVETQENSAQA